MLKKYSVRHVSSEAGKLLRYLGPGILITVGFIDPGNWAANIAAGSGFGYSLLWMVTLSTIMLVFLQHNVAHLGIVTGLCLAEATTTYLPPFLSRFLLITAVVAYSNSLSRNFGRRFSYFYVNGYAGYSGGFIDSCLLFYSSLDKLL